MQSLVKTYNLFKLFVYDNKQQQLEYNIHHSVFITVLMIKQCSWMPVQGGIMNCQTAVHVKLV